ncbi:siderophore-interacting protein [Nisaea sediminum]|uniref:siderophore-interacting protein n=1 Tax=Nisaea sediminum TaxID=2775867 RepID=UPI0018669F3B|nr:siderophore-interacting protein [Nisaea sediminum]
MQSEISVEIGNAGVWLEDHVRHLATHDLHPVARHRDRAVFETSYGKIRLAADADRLSVRIDSPDEDGLTVLQGSVSEYLIAHDPALAKGIVWSGTAPAPGRPKNLREMTIVRTRALCDWLLRMTLKGKDLTPFTERGLHVRLMLPRDPARPEIVWPTIETSGAIRFPAGKDELTVRVYTVREISPERGEVEIDIVRHAGGLFSDWAESARPGDRIGMIGPGGGHFPAGGWLAIGGDDTAVPAIMRILEARSGTDGGHAIIGLRPHQDPLAVSLPDGFTLDWVPIDDLPAALKAATAARGADQTGWFAGEAEQAKEIREHFKTALGLAPERRYSAVYWRRDETAKSQ